MKRKPEILVALREHYNLNVSLGIMYAQFSQKAINFKMPYFAKFLKYLSDDKLTVHKDLILEHLDRIQETEPFKFEMIKLMEGCDKISSAKELAEFVLKTEELVREKIRTNAKLFLREDDYETYEFWTWYINDGLKDFGEIVAINDLFTISSDLLGIDHQIKKILKHAEKDND